MRRIRSLLAPLRSRDFALIWLGQGISHIGDACTQIALVWLLVGLTGSSLLLGSVLSAMYIPTLLLLLVGGVVADRGSRRTTVLICDGIRAVAIAAFAVLATQGVISLPMVFILAAFMGSRRRSSIQRLALCIPPW
ncbi:MAG TPA: MFS transporter [Ktedonobacterales bacterium]